jgi:acyltransferase
VPEPTQPTTRVVWIDRAKAVGILLVVVGHVAALPREITDYIYRFHMPLFFMLAGAVASPGRLAEGFRPWVVRQARGLVVPYLFFWAISAGWWLVIRNIGEKAAESAGVPLRAPLDAFFLGTGESLFINPPLWFFPALFVAAVAFWPVWKLTRGRPLMLAVSFVVWWVSGSLMPTSPAWARVWNADLLPWTCAAYTMGHLARLMVNGWSRRMDGFGKRLSALTLLALVVAVAGVYLPVWDWNGREFGPIPGLSLIASLTMAGAFCYLLGRLPGAWSGGWLARETLFIFPLHGLVFSVLTGAISMGLGVRNWSENGGWPAVAVYALAGTCGSLVAGMILKRIMPFLFGVR